MYVCGCSVQGLFSDLLQMTGLGKTASSVGCHTGASADRLPSAGLLEFTGYHRRQHSIT